MDQLLPFPPHGRHLVTDSHVYGSVPPRVCLRLPFSDRLSFRDTVSHASLVKNSQGVIPPLVSVSLAPALTLSVRLIMALCLIYLCVPGN